MMQDTDLLAIDSPSTFEKLCSDLLVAEGCQNVRGLGVGPDSGRDILVDIPLRSPIGHYSEIFMVQCKFYASRSISVRELNDAYNALPMHNAQGLLFIASCSFSGAAVTKAEALDQDMNSPYRVKLWDGNEIVRRLQHHPVLVAKYFYASRSAPVSASAAAAHADGLGSPEKPWSEKFAPPPPYAKVTMETFPRTSSNELAVAQLRKHAAVYGEKPPLVLLITGAVGSGKTGFAFSLLNGCAASGVSVAHIHNYMFASLFYDYVLEGDDRFPSALAYLLGVDYLLLDDYGLGMNDKSETQVRVAETLIEVTKIRIQNKKPTVVTVADFNEPGPTVRMYLTYLKASFPVVSCGTENLRRRRADAGRETPTPEIRGRWLGRAWLSEKMCEAEDWIKQAIEVAATPDDEFAAQQRLLKERYGQAITREQEVVSILEHIRDRLRDWRGFVESFPFDAVREDDEGVHLEP